MILIGLAIALFASTNIDDIFVLVSFFADQRLESRYIVLGQYIGIATLFAVSLLASLLSLVISRPHLGLLGFIPIIIGLHRLRDLWKVRDLEEASFKSTMKTGAYAQFATVAMLTIANGGDNVGIYTPAFAVRSIPELTVIALVFAVMTALWCFLAYWLAYHPSLGHHVRRYGNRVTPFVLVGLGVSILYEAGSFPLLSSFCHF